ncbi:hypothetical protein PFAG_01902 [Plasmodium falciparum Santa Lucia]|uniref:Uncharacterized protein n=2 Tax=Plasmodium falciparum TaxID=5833 RepID=W7FPR0_PLAF8|nr:hypothetical protein PFBG_01974 [Plasmodium falciparum 7G8]EUT87578.1 hypothetical protein PFAG_01902 [Plasmodium falciparum Santa Lucia]
MNTLISTIGLITKNIYLNICIIVALAFYNFYTYEKYYTMEEKEKEKKKKKYEIICVNSAFFLLCTILSFI